MSLNKLHEAGWEVEFRVLVAEFIAGSLPRDMAKRGQIAVHPTREDYLGWAGILSKQGWSAPAWPKEHGGAGWTVRQREIFEEEAMLAGAPPLHIQSVDLVGPLIVAFGSAEQQSRLLPPILKGQEIWAQGFSEPDSGSDLANLRTRAVRAGDAYVVNGQKIWTSDAYMANHIFCLVRTNPDVKPQCGLSMLLFPLDLPGITVRPIPLIDGGHSLCEVFFDDVRVTVDCLLGQENEGWTYAKFLLGNERTKTAEVPRNKRELRRLKRLLYTQASSNGVLIEDLNVRRKLASLEVDLLALEVGVENASDSIRANVLPAPSVLKLQGTVLMQSILEMSREALGVHGAVYYDVEKAPTAATGELPGPLGAPGLTAEFLFRRAATIYGGSSEIQKNIIAKTLRAADESSSFADLQGDQILLQASLNRFVEREYTFEMRKRLVEADAPDRLYWSTFAEQGWLGATLPEAVGGFGGSAGDGALIQEAYGRALMLEPLMPGLLAARTLAGIDVERFSAEIGSFVAGEAVFALAHEEALARGNVSHVKTMARRAEQGYVLSGSKCLVLGAPQADRLLVSARTSGAPNELSGISLFMLPPSAEGLTIQSYRTIDDRVAWDIVLDDVQLPDSARIGEEGKAGNALKMAWSRAIIDTCAEMIGAMDKSIWITRDYLVTRKQFGKHLFEFQALQHDLASMFVELERSRNLLFLALRALEDTSEVNLERFVSGAKARINRSAFFVGARAVQLHGGIAITQEYPIGSYFKRICVLNSLFGGEAHHLDQYAVASRMGADPEYGRIS